MNQPRPGQTPDAAWQIQTLADSARQLSKRGELLEAERIYRQILEVAPYHVRALNFLAVQSLGRGELDESKRHLEQALRAAPDRAILHQNLGLVLKDQGDLEGALASLDRAIHLKPEHRFASLHKGAVLEAMGRTDEAVMVYAQAWKYFPDLEVAANHRFNPPSLRDLIKQAAGSLRMAQLKTIHESMADALGRHGKEALSRVIEAADIYVGERPPQYQHGLQHPAFIYMPGLAPQSFFDRARFDWVPKLEAATAVIREELQAALATNEGFAPYVQLGSGADPLQSTELNGSLAWSSLHLNHKVGTPVEENRRRCPKTAQIVDALPLPMIPGHAPEVLFSILQAGTHIPPHFGLANYKLVTHLPLIVPPDCSIRVGNETRSWREGECLIFDDSFQHEAWNRSDRRRAVLILDVWHPDVTAAEQEGIKALARGIVEFKSRYMQAT